MNSADRDALNYPYIRVRSIDWLKRTLLIFPHVVRMTPFSDAPADDPEVASFTYVEGKRGGLLRAADLNAKHVRTAQSELITQLRLRLGTEEDFRRKFSRAARRRHADSSIGRELTVWERRISHKASFQIHAYKLFAELAGFLREEGLAWEPEQYYSDGSNYLEMHPALGEAVMATLAVACAENEGLQVVTEFPDLHGKIIGTPREQILAGCLDGSERNGATSGQQLAELLVYRRCDVEMVSAENILALQDEREALADFRGKLDDLAKSLPPTIFSEKHLQQRLDDTLADMFREWERDQPNLGGVGKRFFGEGLISETGKLAQKLVEAALKPEAAQALASGAIVGGVSGGASFVPILTGAGAGFFVAVVFRGFENLGSARKAKRTSPLRYLTRMQEQGVVFSLSR